MIDAVIIMSTQAILLLDDQCVDMKFITRLTGLTDKWFYKLLQDEEFHKPIKLGRSPRWLKSEVKNWLQVRITESIPPPSVSIAPAFKSHRKFNNKKVS